MNTFESMIHILFKRFEFGHSLLTQNLILRFRSFAVRICHCDQMITLCFRNKTLYHPAKKKV